MALDTQESESESIKKINKAGKDIIIPESGIVCNRAGSGVTLAAEDTLNRESVETKSETVSIPMGRLVKERLSVRDKMDASLSSRKR